MKPEDVPENVRQAFEDALADALLAGLDDGPEAKDAERKGIETAVKILIDHCVDKYQREILVSGLREVARDMKTLDDFLTNTLEHPQPAETTASQPPAHALAPNEFRCAQCGETFEKGLSDEEAAAEREENGWSGVECDLVCDDCYREVLAWAAEKGLP